MKKLLLIPAGLALSSCAGTQIVTTPEMVTFAEQTQATKIAAATATAVGCKSGTISSQDCKIAMNAYFLWGLANTSKWEALYTNCQDVELQKRIQKIMEVGYPTLDFGRLVLE